MRGLVKTSFANLLYMDNVCKTVVPANESDPNYSAIIVGTSCLTIDDAARGFYFCTNFSIILN